MNEPRGKNDEIVKQSQEFLRPVTTRESIFESQKLLDQSRYIEEVAIEVEGWKKEAECKVKEMMVTQYSPFINERSRKLALKRTKPVYERLYQNAVVRKKNERFGGNQVFQHRRTKSNSIQNAPATISNNRKVIAAGSTEDPQLRECTFRPVINYTLSYGQLLNEKAAKIHWNGRSNSVTEPPTILKQQTTRKKPELRSSLIEKVPKQQIYHANKNETNSGKYLLETKPKTIIPILTERAMQTEFSEKKIIEYQAHKINSSGSNIMRAKVNSELLPCETDLKNKETYTAPTFNSKEESLLEKMEKQKFIAIFQALDSDKDGFISSNNVNLDAIPKKLLEIFEPIFANLETKQGKMNLSEFVNVAFSLYNSLSIIDKKAVLDFKNTFVEPSSILKPKDLFSQPPLSHNKPSFSPFSSTIHNPNNHKEFQRLQDLKCCFTPDVIQVSSNLQAP